MRVCARLRAVAGCCRFSYRVPVHALTHACRDGLTRDALRYVLHAFVACGSACPLHYTATGSYAYYAALLPGIAVPYLAFTFRVLTPHHWHTWVLQLRTTDAFFNGLRLLTRCYWTAANILLTVLTRRRAAVLPRSGSGPQRALPGRLPATPAVLRLRICTPFTPRSSAPCQFLDCSHAAG